MRPALLFLHGCCCALFLGAVGFLHIPEAEAAVGSSSTGSGDSSQDSSAPFELTSPPSAVQPVSSPTTEEDVPKFWRTTARSAGPAAESQEPWAGAEPDSTDDSDPERSPFDLAAAYWSHWSPQRSVRKESTPGDETAADPEGQQAVHTSGGVTTHSDTTEASNSGKPATTSASLAASPGWPRLRGPQQGTLDQQSAAGHVPEQGSAEGDEGQAVQDTHDGGPRAQQAGGGSEGRASWALYEETLSSSGSDAQDSTQASGEGWVKRKADGDDAPGTAQSGGERMVRENMAPPRLGPMNDDGVSHRSLRGTPANRYVAECPPVTSPTGTWTAPQQQGSVVSFSIVFNSSPPGSQQPVTFMMQPMGTALQPGVRTMEPTPVPMQQPTPVPMQQPTPVPMQQPTPVPMQQPTPLPMQPMAILMYPTGVPLQQLAGLLCSQPWQCPLPSLVYSTGSFPSTAAPTALPTLWTNGDTSAAAAPTLTRASVDAPAASTSAAAHAPPAAGQAPARRHSSR